MIKFRILRTGSICRALPDWAQILGAAHAASGSVAALTQNPDILLESSVLVRRMFTEHQLAQFAWERLYDGSTRHESEQEGSFM